MAKRGKGQSGRLQRQHELAGGPKGIFGKLARQHDLAIGVVMSEIVRELKIKWPNLSFRHRTSVSKKEVNNKLMSVNPSLGKTLFIKNASIKPDGGVIEVKDRFKKHRILLVGESKHQGNDIEKIQAGIKQGKRKDQDLMVAGNAIERVHKNIQEFRNLMLDEIHFPYVVFLQGSNFSTKTFFVETPDGRSVTIAHDAGNLNRIDRVTASSYGMEINRTYCRNAFVELDNRTQMLQAASLYFQAEPWSAGDMVKVLWSVALTSIDILGDNLMERA